jgi:serine/threonine protein kinase
MAYKMQNKTSAEQHAHAVHNLTFLPILRRTLIEINTDHGAEWAYQFARVGIKDSSFPTPREAMEKTCISLGLNIPEVQLRHFDILQYQYFQPLAKDGMHFKYPDGKSTPYKVVVAEGFPAFGSFGQVDKVAAFLDETKFYARKRLLDLSDMARIAREVHLLKTFKHPHSVPFYGSYEHNGGYYLIFEFCDGDLETFFKTPPVWFTDLSDSAQASKTVNWMIDLASCLADFHAGGGIHRDLKSQNILLKGDRLLIADFGLATQSVSPSSNLASIHGTEKYMAPEQGYTLKYGRSADVFAMGCIMLELLAFGHNISVQYFDDYRRMWGPGKCDHSHNTCYRHNLKGVARFIGEHFRSSNKDSELEPLIDIIEFEAIADRPTLRSAARDIRRKLVLWSADLPFFDKDDCCAVASSMKYDDLSMKSLADRLGSMTVAKEVNEMQVDLKSIVGPLKAGFFKK